MPEKRSFHAYDISGLTPAQRRVLYYALDNGPLAWWPSHVLKMRAVRERLIAAGYLERTDYADCGCSTWDITSAGRQALEA